ncbi:MAG: amidohydrolase family protein [Bacilli bacterium]|nr:amidohydrolase family protein [Bacilli bacterium]
MNIKDKNFVVHGDIAYSNPSRKLETMANGYLVVEKGNVIGTFAALPEKFASLPVVEAEGKLVVPGFVDLHVHASQYAFRGNGMDRPLLEWLESYAFPEERKFAEEAYAKKAYGIFASDLKKTFTTRASIFATVHFGGTKILADILEATGLKTYVGIVNMNRNAPDFLVHKDEETAWKEAEEFALYAQNLANVDAIITPRFIPTCGDRLMEGLAKIREKYGLKIQTHLDENHAEIDWVKSLCPWAKSYADAYDHFGMLEGSVMAHCVHTGNEDMALLKERGTFIAHCPESNVNVYSGIAPVRKYLEAGLNVGLGSDVAGGSGLNLCKEAKLAIQLSKAYKVYADQNATALTAEDAFYLATLGGGRFFGKVGSFLSGYEADILILNDRGMYPLTHEMSIQERIERLLYVGHEDCIEKKFVAGIEVV